MVCSVLFPGDKKTPRLLIVGRRCPSRCFQYRLQIFVRNVPLRKGARTPAAADQLMNIGMRVGLLLNSGGICNIDRHNGTFLRCCCAFRRRRIACCVTVTTGLASLPAPPPVHRLQRFPRLRERNSSRGSSCICCRVRRGERRSRPHPEHCFHRAIESLL